MKVRHLFISPGHNFFGHHGRPAGTHPIEEVSEVKCVHGQGLEGDRFFGYKDDYKGQITLFSLEIFRRLCRERGASPESISPAALRRNVIVEGADLASLIGKRFVLQEVELEGVEECRPCYWMDQAVGEGTEAWLRGRGGLRCRILSDGRIHVDDDHAIREGERT